MVFLTRTLLAYAAVSLSASAHLACAAPPAAPSGLVFASSTANNQGTIGWVDNSDDEINFAIDFKFGDAPTFSTLPQRRAANETDFGITGFLPGTPVTFRVRAWNEDGFSDFSNEIVAITENYHIVASCITVTPGEDFSRVIATNFGEDVSLVSALPEWLSWDEPSQTLSGVASPEGIERVTFSASSGIHSRVRDFFVQVINEAPVGTDPLPVVDLSDEAGGLSAVMIDLFDHFEDPDMGRAAVMNTPFGPINIGFYDDPTVGAPGTVANFFAYADAERWDGTFFHRSVQNFVIQGGGFLPDGLTEGSFVGVESFDPIVNEFDAVNRSNICGTISMAKVGDILGVPNTPETPNGPDSATSQWFISIDDNQAILNPQNGGFTVFGRAAEMNVVDQISAFPTGSYDIEVDGSLRDFSDFPLSTITESSPLVSELASMSSVDEIPTLSFSLAGGDPEIATAALVGSQLTITPIGPGQVEFVITATDLDDAQVSLTHGVTISNSYLAWAEDQGLQGVDASADENRDGGVLVNLQEYAFGGDPVLAADDNDSVPTLGEIVVPETGTFDTIVFRQRQFASDLEYKVQSSTDLESWNDLWTEEDVNGVLVSDEQGDDGFSTLTVRRIDPQGSGDERFFFRVVVSLVLD